MDKKPATSTPNNKTVPQQRKGRHTHTAFSIVLPSAEESRQRYRQAKERLLDVNHWHELSGALSANFTLTDEEGQPVDHTAQEGDHIRIDLPDPGSIAGRGYDWVAIEKIEDKSTASGNTAYVAIRVRPAGHPQDLEGRGQTAHFFHPNATSSFVVEMTGKCVRASVYGRNEQPNKTSSGLWDKLRNKVVAISALLGFSRPQWKGLVKGLLK
ncbi:hypothetical protein [Chitinophaga japonensis]|uniref:Uncharacterized protein n=1 Tax=Chitinophaga japonensis TaxID=104662 RepID=A0A562SUL1_CHIJA|nr:hypothetical protein [Chitinophaga japonensis]TWI84386.1 hypothetical protein LX66_4753 [Chitinophaga japonensis]